MRITYMIWINTFPNFLKMILNVLNYPLLLIKKMLRCSLSAVSVFMQKNHLTYQPRLAIHILEFQIKMDLKKYFLTGIATVVPLAATVYILMSPSGGLTAQVSPSPMQSSREAFPASASLSPWPLFYRCESSSPTLGRKTAELVDEVMRRIPLSRSICSIIINISDILSFGEPRVWGSGGMVKFLPDVYALGFLACRSPSGGRGSNIFQTPKRIRARLT